MIEQGATVIAVEGDRATVTAERASGCGSCSARSGCGVGVLGRVLGKRVSEMEVTTRIAVAPGDQVVIGMRENGVLLGSLWLYLVPLLLFIGGALVARTVADNIGAGEWLVVLGALAGGAAGLAWAGAHTRSRPRQAMFEAVILRKQAPATAPRPAG